MPRREYSSERLSISRQAVFLDTNVLFAAFWDEDEKHEMAKYFLEVFTDEIVVPIPVIIECWGVIVGSKKRIDRGLAVLEWVHNPGNATLIPAPPELLGRTRTFCSKLHIDLVDAFLVSLADDLSARHQITPAIRIVTFDNRDFFKCIGLRRDNLQIRLMNPETGDVYP